LALGSEYPTAFGKNPPRVLIVDDDLGIRRMVGRILGKAGCIVVHAENGEQARSLCAARPLFHVAIVDVTLPDADGWCLVGELRDLLGERSPAFVVMSGAIDEDAPLPAGVSAMLAKPVSMRDLMEVIGGLARSVPS
jgi:two-component system phosphate regulon response regulator OmpR